MNSRTVTSQPVNPVIKGDNRIANHPMFAAARPQGEQDATIQGGNFAAELGDLDFAVLLGGPLQAAVQAQIASSVATVDFIENVAFEGEGENKKLRMANFSYAKTVDGEAKPVTVSVPYITLLPIPSLRIETVEIGFNVKLNSVETASSESLAKIGASGSGRIGPVKFKVTTSYQRKNSYGLEVKKEYAMNVNIKATQDEIPEGLSKVMGLLAV